jgi:hypothetical protein
MFSRIIGLRWIFEALVGGDLSGINPEWFVSTLSDKPEDQLPYIKAELAHIIATLREKKHILVGHNIFTDLGFMYNAFVGRLPASVKDFQDEIHELFPTVFDTKYLATHNADSMGPRAGLKDLLNPFRKVHVPLIVLHEQHTAYGASFGKEHEAGFDSWMTAELFVKLSAKLYSTYDDSSTGGYTYTGLSAYTNGSVYLSAYPHPEAIYYSDGDDNSVGGARLHSRTPSPTKKDHNQTTAPSGTLHQGSVAANHGYSEKFQHHGETGACGCLGCYETGMLASLSITSQNQDLNNANFGNPKNGSISTTSLSSQSTMTFNTHSSGGALLNAGYTSAFGNMYNPNGYIPSRHASMIMQDNLPPSYHAKLLNRTATVLYDNDEDARAAQQEPVVQQWLPHMDHLFWGSYVNKLRVNAVEGGVCELAK